MNFRDFVETDLSWHRAIDNDQSLMDIYADYLQDQGNPMGFILALQRDQKELRSQLSWPNKQDPEILQRYKEVTAELDKLVQKYHKEMVKMPFVMPVKHLWEKDRTMSRHHTPGMCHVSLGVYPGYDDVHLPHIHIIVSKRGSSFATGWTATAFPEGQPEVTRPFPKFNEASGQRDIYIPLRTRNVDRVEIALAYGSDRAFKWKYSDHKLTPMVPISGKPEMGYGKIIVTDIVFPLFRPRNDEPERDYEPYR